MVLKEISKTAPVGHKSLRKEYTGLLKKLKRIDKQEASTDIIIRINRWIDFINDSYPIDFECNLILAKDKIHEIIKKENLLSENRIKSLLLNRFR